MCAARQLYLPQGHTDDAVGDAIVVTDHETAIAECRIPTNPVQDILNWDHG